MKSTRGWLCVKTAYGRSDLLVKVREQLQELGLVVKDGKGRWAEPELWVWTGSKADADAASALISREGILVSTGAV